MKKNISAIIIGLGLLPHPAIYTAESINQQLQRQLIQLRQNIACIWHNKGCSQKELHNTQLLIGSIVVGLLLITGLKYVPWKDIQEQWQISARKKRWQKEGSAPLIIKEGEKADYERQTWFF